MQHAHSLTFDFVVVGAGPSGSVLALLLSQKFKVLLIEKRTAVENIPKAVHLDKHTIHILKTVKSFDFAAFPLNEIIYKNKDTTYFHLTQSDLTRLNEYKDSVWFQQKDLESTLWDNIEKTENITFLKGESVNYVAADAQIYQVKTTNYQINAKVLFAADGAKSIVRQQLGLNYDVDMDFHQTWTVVDIKDKQGLLPITHIQYCSPEKAFTYIKFDDVVRFEYLSDGMTNLNKILKEEFKFDTDIAIQKIREVKYTFHALRMTNMAWDKVYFVGDAAHLMPPFAGKGLCSGLKDAFNIAWKYLYGFPNEKCSISYTEERKPFLIKDIQVSTILGKLISGHIYLLHQQFLCRVYPSLLRAIVNISQLFFLFTSIKKHTSRHFSLLKGYYFHDVFYTDKCVHPKLYSYDFKVICTNGLKEEIQSYLQLVPCQFIDYNEINCLYKGGEYLKYDFFIIRPDMIIFYAGKKKNLISVEKELRSLLQY